VVRASDASAPHWLQTCGVEYGLVRVAHSNLGGLGPDTGSEGITYQVQEYNNSEIASRDLLVDVHANSEYTSEISYMNGMRDKFGWISVNAGTQVSLCFSFSTMNKEPITMGKVWFTVYDLDSAAPDESRDYVIASKTASVETTIDAQILEDTHPEGYQFIGKSVGTSADLPKSPKSITELQKRRVVVLEYSGIDHFNLTFGTTHGQSPRNFAFAFLDALHCRKELRAVPSTELATTLAATTATTTATTTAATTTTATTASAASTSIPTASADSNSTINVTNTTTQEEEQEHQRESSTENATENATKNTAENTTANATENATGNTTEGNRTEERNHEAQHDQEHPKHSKLDSEAARSNVSDAANLLLRSTRRRPTSKPSNESS